MNLVARDKLGVPLPLFRWSAGSPAWSSASCSARSSTRRAGTAFAMISLGLGELVSSARSSCALLRRRGRHRHQPHQAAAFFGCKFGPQIQIYYLIAAWCFVCHGRDVRADRARRSAACATPCATIPSASSSSATTRDACASMPSCFAAIFAGIAGGAGGDQFRDRSTRSSSARSNPALVLLMTFVGGVGHFFGPILGAVLVTCLQMRCQRRHRGLAALFRPAVHRRRDVRAGRHRGLDRAARARPARRGDARVSRRPTRSRRRRWHRSSAWAACC